jgi:hypothetical protein
MEEKSNLYIVAIVGIVAVVALVLMATGIGTQKVAVTSAGTTTDSTGHTFVAYAYQLCGAGYPGSCPAGWTCSNNVCVSPTKAN